MDRRPDPPPLKTDDARTVAVGTALFAAAFVGLLPFYGDLERDGRLWLLWMCVCGMALGGIGAYYCKRRERAIARDAAIEAEADVPRS